MGFALKCLGILIIAAYAILMIFGNKMFSPMDEFWRSLNFFGKAGEFNVIIRIVSYVIFCLGASWIIRTVLKLLAKPLKKGKVIVERADLKETEFYTIIAKNGEGKVIFTKDGVEPFTEYRFTVQDKTDLYFYLDVSGKTYAMSQILLPDYDFEEAFWNWSENHLQATVSFMDKNGGEPLYVDATVTRKVTEATCEEDCVAVYTAKATYEGKTFTQKESVVIDAPGHSYEGTVHDDGHITYVCSVCGDTYTDEE